MIILLRRNTRNVEPKNNQLLERDSTSMRVGWLVGCGGTGNFRRIALSFSAGGLSLQPALPNLTLLCSGFPKRMPVPPLNEMRSIWLVLRV